MFQLKFAEHDLHWKGDVANLSLRFLCDPLETFPEHTGTRASGGCSQPMGGQKR